MKQGIHPDYVECTVKCTCGNTFTTRSTKSELRVDICNACHPFFTGQQKFIDTGGRVQRFADKFGSAKDMVAEREAAKKAKRAAAVAEAEAAKKADAHEFIRHLPLQYNTYLEEAGNGLSGGEKQRIALARAFLKDSGLYILDESTSNLDFATENLIFNMIYEQLADRSMLIVAHRLSTVRDCDLILVMDHGKIVERGTHDELLAKEGKYYELWNMQQGIYRSKKAEPKQSVMQAVVEEDDDGESITY